MTGTEIMRLGTELLRAAGWLVVVFNSNRRSPVKGWVDLAAFKHGVTLLVEVKGAGDRLRPEQREFADSIGEHLGPGLRYVLARDVAAFLEIAGAC